MQTQRCERLTGFLVSRCLEQFSCTYRKAMKPALHNLSLDISSASVARLTGNADAAYINAAGACKVHAFKLKTGNATINATGASQVSITANKKLNAVAVGGSAIAYKGEAIVTRK